MTSADLAPVEEHLRRLAGAAGAETRAAPHLAATVLQTRRRTSLRRRVGVGAAVGLVVAGSVAAISLRPGPYFEVSQPSAVMDPAVPEGAVVTFSSDLDPVVRDVVILQPPSGGTSVRSISRVLGAAGDVVACPAEADGACRGVEVNGERVDDPYLDTLVTQPFDAVTVPQDAVFVLGDQRGAALDSRAFGPVPTDAVEGVAVSVRVGDGPSQEVLGAPRHQAPDEQDLIEPPLPVPPAGASPAS